MSTGQGARMLGAAHRPGRCGFCVARVPVSGPATARPQSETGHE